MTEVVCKGQVSGERVGEGMIEFQNFQYPDSLDSVKVTVGERAHIGGRLTNRLLLPKVIAKYVTFTWKTSEDNSS